MAIKQCTCDLTIFLKTADLDAQATALGYVKAEYVDEKTNVPEYKLPYTADELAAKLESI